jgi:3-phenylpropionate/trans-cinnamate dioxygenase ferredoxin component
MAEIAQLKWVDACNVDDIDEEDVIRFDHGGATYAIYRLEEGFHASDGYCTHEKAHLADGFVVNGEIECPLHQGRFDIASGQPKSAPVCIKLRTHPVRVDGDRVMIGIADKDAA